MPLTLLLLVTWLGQAASQPPGRITNQAVTTPSGVTMTYGLSVPGDNAPGGSRPLILALHPGGDRVPGYGSRFMQQVVLPALAGMGAVIVAPDCPAKSWSEPAADEAVMALVEKVRKEYAIDTRRILVTGFSMGGRGTWYMSSQHPNLFTGAIAMAASTRELTQDSLGKIPTYVIHSRDDQVVSFDAAEQNAHQLEKLGRPVKFEELRGPGHYQMGGYVESLQRAGRWIAAQWGQ
jgi:predicted peptidase